MRILRTLSGIPFFVVGLLFLQPAVESWSWGNFGSPIVAPGALDGAIGLLELYVGFWLLFDGLLEGWVRRKRQ